MLHRLITCSRISSYTVVTAASRIRLFGHDAFAASSTHATHKHTEEDTTLRFVNAQILIVPPADIVARVAQIQHTLQPFNEFASSGIEWQPEALLHIPVFSLGVVDSTQISLLVAQVVAPVAASCTAFRISLDQVSCWPSWNKPRIVCATHPSRHDRHQSTESSECVCVCVCVSCSYKSVSITARITSSKSPDDSMSACNSGLWSSDPVVSNAGHT
jgi:hypothetical protein